LTSSAGFYKKRSCSGLLTFHPMGGQQIFFALFDMEERSLDRKHQRLETSRTFWLVCFSQCRCAGIVLPVLLE
jgi:hypothetical protein